MNQNVYDFDKAARARYLREKTRKYVLLGAAAVLCLLLLSQSLFVVGEAEQCVVSRFGIIRKVILNQSNTFHSDYADLLEGEITTSGKVKVENTSGLHFKMPFIDTVQTYTSRMYT